MSLHRRRETCHNNFIEENIKQIVKNFDIYINEWINKNNNKKIS